MLPESAETVEVTINGDARAIPKALSVLGLLELLDIPPARVAVELDRGILKKELWASTLLHGGEQLEIVHFVGGG